MLTTRMQVTLLLFVAVLGAPLKSRLSISPLGPGSNGLSRTPPMGWMAWETFRCETNCTEHPNGCVNEDLFFSMTDALVSGGYAAAGYNQISIDDCWASSSRDDQGLLVPNATRFPSGLTNLSKYMHDRGVRFGLYSDIGTKTCEGYPGDDGFIASDANQFAGWGVDYLKVDGCYGSPDLFASGYPSMGASLQSTGRDMIYSCSWPAYLGNNETQKPFADMIAAGCNLWRNWDDIQNKWESLASIIDHFGYYSRELQPWAGPGHWHDMDMILAGSSHFDNRLTPDQARVQMAIWSIMASPLMLSADLRVMPAVYRDIVLNPEVIAINQDPLGLPGIRVTADLVQLWLRKLQDGCVAVALYNPTAEGLTASLPLPPAESGLANIGRFRIRDLFERADLPLSSSLISFFVNPTAAVFLKICAA